MALSLDIVEKRRQYAIKIGQVYERTFRVPVGSADDDIPARGDIQVLDGVTPTTGVLAPRVLHNPRRRNLDNGMIEVTITFIQAESY